MVTKANRFDGQRAPAWWARFGRDVLASLLATGLATVGFSHLAREPVDPPPPAPAGKVQDRLAWQVEDVRVRITRTFDSLAMFGLRQVEPSPWSTAPALTPAEPLVAPRPGATSRIVAQGGEPLRRTLAALPPPHRPAAHLPAGRIPEIAHPAETAASGRTEPPRFLGWELPSDDVLPSGLDMMRKVASLGDAVAGAGEAIAAGVGLR